MTSLKAEKPSVQVKKDTSKPNVCASGVCTPKTSSPKPVEKPREVKKKVEVSKSAPAAPKKTVK